MATRRDYSIPSQPLSTWTNCAIVKTDRYSRSPEVPLTLSVIVRLAPAALPAALPALRAVYEAAFRPAPYYATPAQVARFAASLEHHVTRAGFRCLVAQDT